jgi:hypothetical protein
MLAVGVVGATQ